MNIRDSLRKIGAAFLSTREVSSQECVYRCMPELWLKNIFPATVCIKMYLFITEGAGARKSHLIRTIYHTIVKTFRYPPIYPEKPIVLLPAPAGVAAINIDGRTTNTVFAIPKYTKENELPGMSDQKRTQMRLLLSELKLMIIDEISMVANITLLHIHQRLKEIVATTNSHFFAGISIIAVGDLYQLPPIRRKPVFENYIHDIFNIVILGMYFK